MAWEDRNGSRYYYRKRRSRGRVISEYIGAGFLAEAEADLAQQEREQAAETRRRLQEQAAEAHAIDTQLDRIEEFTGTMVKALALLAGYHPHKGQWRRRKYGA